MAAITRYLWFLLAINFVCVVTRGEDDADEDSTVNYSFPSANSGRGFGSHFQWLDFSKGLEVAKATRRPMMLIVHKSWCSSCKALKPQFAASKEIAELGKGFVMVNSGDREEPRDKKYAPDGDYIPRILFLSPDGDLRPEFFNEAGNPNYKYFYADTWSIIATMKKVAQTFKKKQKVPVKEL